MDKYLLFIFCVVILVLGLTHTVKAHGSQSKPVEPQKAMIVPKVLKDAPKASTVQNRAILMAVPLMVPAECKDKKLRQQCIDKLKGK